MNRIFTCATLLALALAPGACTPAAPSGDTLPPPVEPPRFQPGAGDARVAPDDPICTPGMTQNFCPTPNSVTVCVEDGSQWQEVFCPGVEVCYQGECVDYACAPESTMCLDPKTVATCEPDGGGGFAWAESETCEGICNQGACIGSCGYDIKDKSGDDCEFWSVGLTGDTHNPCVETNYLAIPSSGANQLAVYDISVVPPKLHTGSPFLTCGDPSRILIDGAGHVIATCRMDGHVRKHTTEGEDVWDMQLPGCWSVRGIVVGPEGRLFAGCTDSRNVHELDPDTGAVLNTIATQRDVYGMAVDQTGIYVSDFGGLTKIALGGDADLSIIWNITSSGYGLAADGAGKVWLAETPGLTSYDTETGAMVDVVDIEGPLGGGDPWNDPWFAPFGMCNGVTVGLDGRIYVGCADSGNFVAVYDPTAETFEYHTLPVGDEHPRGVAVDSDDNVYTLNMFSNNITRFDAITKEAVSVNDGALMFPYGYSGDLTALQPCLIGAAQTWISPVLDYDNPDTTWLRVEWQSETPEGTSIVVFYRVDSGAWIPVLNGMELGVKGQTFQVKVGLDSDVEGVAATLDKLAVYYE